MGDDLDGEVRKGGHVGGGGREDRRSSSFDLQDTR